MRNKRTITAFMDIPTELGTTFETRIHYEATLRLHEVQQPDVSLQEFIENRDKRVFRQDILAEIGSIMRELAVFEDELDRAGLKLGRTEP